MICFMCRLEVGNRYFMPTPPRVSQKNRKKLFTSKSQLQLNGGALRFLVYKPISCHLTVFFYSFLFFVSTVSYHRLTATALYKLPALLWHWQLQHNGDLGGGQVLELALATHTSGTHFRQKLAVAKTKVNICFACVCVWERECRSMCAL